ncbi:DUF5702 domain-containing protein [Saccharibacillus alkalitolerans]|uniref:Flp pilus-assembly TadG-like N-terminal domain-containing protein n=1 Tax=Saccharibacillus alkalitolerans TaxID=2705290 RepID=A0ABX0F8V3_9BACL|nr:DUF5702 domain-containing protein [Saccharibacillus alkalitolerans]NGZ76008.1 hypothetical protein [Saccharibacillus alkalitolerans]
MKARLKGIRRRLPIRYCGRLWKREHGSITIFLSLVLAVTLAFVAIFIDYSRMAALKAKSERLMHAAARSAMSAYVPELQRSYGLFAYGETDPSLIFSGVLERSLEYKEREGVLPITDAKLVSSSVELSRELGDYEIFKTQINEEMKYKAPVNFAIEVVGRFKPMSQAMKEASGAVEVLEKLQKLYDKREAELDSMLKLQKDAGKRTDSLVEQIGTNGSGDIGNTPLGGGVSTAVDMAAQYNDYKAQKERVSFETPPPETDGEGNPNPDFIEWLELLAKISAYESGSERITSRMQHTINVAFPPHAEDLLQARKHLLKAKEINGEMEAVIAAMGDRSADIPYDQVTRSDIPGAEGGPAGGASSIREQVKELLLKPEFFTAMEGRITGQENDFSHMQSDVNSLQQTLGRAFGDSGMNGYTLKRMVIGAGKTASEYNGRYGSGGSVIGDIEAALREHRQHDEERKKAEQEAKGKIKEVQEIIKFLSETKGHYEDFQTLEKYYRENLALNSGIAAEAEKAALEEDPEAAGKDAMENMDGFFGGIAGLLDATGDRLLQNEYASDHFSNFDYSKMRQIAKPGEPLDGSAAADQLSVEKQELEYIIYGFANPGGNIAAAYGEIFAMRLAIRTMEALTDPKILAFGNPLVILAKAILQGLVEAIADMFKLAEQGYIELSNTLKIRLTYKDHLRLFLFAHPGNDNRLSRMLAVIRFDTGVNPDDHYTYLSGDAAISMPIWFLPGVMKTMNVGEGTWSGSEYTVDLQADYSY